MCICKVLVFKIQNPNPYRYSHHFSETHVNLRLFLTRLTCHYHLTKHVPIFHTRTSTYFILIYKPYWYKSCKTVQTRSKGGWRRWWLYQAWGISFCKMNRNMILKVDLRVTSYYEMRGYYPICALLNNAKVFFMLAKCRSRSNTPSTPPPPPTYTHRYFQNDKWQVCV